ncbi:chromate efflux transporter [Candidatus Poribacteria bacterium]|nr:chromate efflux transporter [Candidatus Poribacteria bacterium]
MIRNDRCLPEGRARIFPVQIFMAFLRLGLTSFGGPTMVAYIRELAVKKRQWLSDESFADGVALCQAIPGATAMQTAAYAGFRAAGPLGALAAFVGFGLSAFILMVILSALYQKTRDFGPVISAFHGLHVIVVAMIANATLNFGRSSIKNIQDSLLAAGAAVFLGSHGSPIVAVLAAAALGLLLYGKDMDKILSAHSPKIHEDTDKPSRFPIVFALAVVIGVAALSFVNHGLFRLATVMMKVDLFAFGGGFASVPLMYHEVVDARHWMDGKTFMDGIALGQVTPGPIVITATFVGYQIRGITGAIIGTIGIFSPSFFMVTAAIPYFDRLQNSLLFRRALRGILVSFVGLLLAVTLHFARAVSWTFPAVVLSGMAFTALRLKVDILWVVLFGALVSVAVL